MKNAAMKTFMKIAVMGAGGIGGYYGGMLARRGADVSLIARGEHLAAILRRGLTVIRDGETFTVAPGALTATGDPAAVGAVDLLLLTTKAYDLEGALEAMAPMVGPDTAVLPLLNGVDVPERIGKRLRPSSVLAGLTYAPANRPEPGVVHQPGPERKLIFGEPDGRKSKRAAAILALFQECGILSEWAEDIQKEIWSKFMLVTANGGVCGVTGSTIGAVLADPGTRRLYEGCCLEVEAVARAQGVALDADAVAETLAHADSTPPGNKPSLLQDLEAGKPLELEFLNGTTARLGRKYGIPVPVNRLIYAALKHREKGGNGG